MAKKLYIVGASSNTSNSGTSGGDHAEYNLFIHEFQNESDRAAAIVGAAVLYDQLKQIITHFLVDDPKEVKALFSPSGALGAFGDRISLAYLLNLISKTQRDDLKIIAWVRNRFAHRLYGLTFSDPEITRETKKLKYSEETTSFKQIGIQQPSSRDRYILAIAYLALHFWSNISLGEHAERRIGEGQKRKDPSTLPQAVATMLALRAVDVPDS